MEVLPISPDTEADRIVASSTKRRGLKRFLRPDWLFLIVVIIPVALATLYFGFLASDIYVSEARFVVRSPEKPATTGLGVILKTAGFTNAGEEVSAAQSYATSRDALKAINKNDAFARAYSKPSISIFDRFNPLGMSGSFEDLYRYFQGKVTLQNDNATSITTLTVRAYDAQSARRFNEELLELSEQRVNRLNERGRHDLVTFAQAEVDQAKARASQAALALAAYRNRSGIIDPEKQAEAQMQMISKLQDSMIAAKTELAQLRRYAPQNPRIPVVQTQIGTLKAEINRELGEVAGNRGSLAASAVQYQRLTLESEFAEKQLGGALASLEEAQNEARRKQVYVERIVQPNLPDAPIEPRRLRGIFAALVLSLLGYGILRMLLAGVREHAL
jgi:BexC/CtrB/KpsE family polysaccharide export inner-membrane protein